MITKEELYGTWIIKEVHYEDNAKQEVIDEFSNLIGKYPFKFSIDETFYKELKGTLSDRVFKKALWKLENDTFILLHSFYGDRICRRYDIEKVSENEYKWSTHKNWSCAEYKQISYFLVEKFG